MTVDSLRLGRLLEIGALFPIHYKPLDEEFKRRGCGMESYAILCTKIEEAFNTTPIENLKSEDNHGYIGEFIRNEHDIVHNVFADFIKHIPFQHVNMRAGVDNE